MKDIERLTGNFSSGIEVEKRLVTRTYEAHWHEFYELEFYISGKGTNIINNKKYEISEGTLFFLSPVDVHSVIISEKTELINIKFSEKWISSELICSLYEPAVIYNYKYDFPKIICEQYNKNMSYENSYIMHLLSCCLTDICRHISGKAKYPDSSVQSAVSYIHRHFRENITLVTLAESIMFTPGYISSVFSKNTGKTFKEYLNDVRLNYAANLLCFSNISITEIGFCSGFNSFASFQRNFKKSFGISPCQYRKQNTENGLLQI